MSNTELQQKIDHMRTVLAQADQKYRKVLEERRTTGTVKKYTPDEMMAVLRAADENYLYAMAERPSSQHKVVYIDSRRRRHNNQQSNLLSNVSR
jgi:hypothetical protein